MSDYFRFEADFIESLRCIPMAVRCKLDMCGIKLKLAEWSRFNEHERNQLSTMSCLLPEEIREYRCYLQGLVQYYTESLPDELAVDANPAWLDASRVPEHLQEKAMAMNVQISLEQWQQLNSLQRFALIKLSKPSHESKNFPHALREFGLMPA